MKIGIGPFVAVAAAGAVLGVIWFARRAAPMVELKSSGRDVFGQPATEIESGAGNGLFANGWRYFTDGTSIDPSGNYYMNGQIIYSTGRPAYWKS